MNARSTRLALTLTVALGLSATGASGANAAVGSADCGAAALRDQVRSAAVVAQSSIARVGARRERLRAAHARGVALLPLTSDPISVPRLKLKAGELVSATGKSSSTLRVVLNDNKARVKKAGLDHDFVPRNVDFSPELGLVAIAAVSEVLLYDPAAGLLTVIDDIPGRASFGFVNDVQFTSKGRLLIADMGDEPVGNLPRDGVVWEYDIEADSFQQIALKRDLSNPSEIELDDRGRALVIDAEGGPEIVPGLGLHSDAVYRLAGAAQNAVRVVYDGPGIVATAFDITADDTHLIGNVTEVVILDGEPMTACPCASTFEFITGLAAAADGTLFVMDGSDSKKNKRTLYELTPFCILEQRVTGSRIGGARGLGLIPES